MVLVDNKRVAVNTLYIYIQVALSIIIGLVSSRLVLQTLGASDYGLYSVVGGALALCAFLSNSFRNSTTRFLSYELGKSDGDVCKIFNVSFVFHFIVAIIVFLLLESVGFFYISKYLSVAQGREADAMFIYQVMVLVSCFSFIISPFRCLFIAHERFLIISVIDIAQSLLKLFFVLCLFWNGGDMLRMYAVGVGSISLISILLYYVLSKLYWPSFTSLKFVKEIGLYKSQLSYCNWNLLSSATWAGRQHGSALLLNFFFGTVTNAAYSLSLVIQRYVNILSINFNKASMPQITRCASNYEYDKATLILCQNARICVLLVLLLFIPIIAELDFILHIWLGSHAPDNLHQFCFWGLISILVSSTGTGLNTFINAIGRLKWFMVLHSSWYIIAFLVACIAYINKLPSYSIFLIFSVVDFADRACQLVILYKMISFDVYLFLKKAYLRPMIILAISCVFLIIHSLFPLNHMLWFVISSIFSFVVVFYIGINHVERQKLFGVFINRLSFVRFKQQ